MHGSSPQYDEKKAKERDDFDLFAAAYQAELGIALTIIEDRESPDFLCRTSDGRTLGVELTQITSHPEMNLYHRLFGEGPARSGVEIADILAAVVIKKAAALRKAGSNLSEIILVVRISDSPLSEISHALQNCLDDDYDDYNFAEIWLADHSTLEAFYQVELFGIHPAAIAGPYPFRGKPFG